MFTLANPNRQPAAVLLLCLLALCVACNRGKTQPAAASAQSNAKRYAFKGKVVSIDKQTRTANVNNEPIPGFMDSMVMGYAIKPAAMLDQLQPGDSITADVVVQGEDYWLENVTVVQHAAAHAAS
jgi:Cu/Ag efflux protein CusF